MNDIQWSKKALKQLLKINKQDQQLVYRKVDTLKQFPGVENVKALKNHRHAYRLRVGQYRVFFDYAGEVKVISVEEVRKRDERTY